MFPGLLRNPEIAKYVKSFPQSQWEKCVDLTLTLGIRAVYKRFPYGISVEALARAVAQTIDGPQQLVPSLTFDYGRLETSGERSKSKIDSPGNSSARSHPTVLTPEQPYINPTRTATPQKPSSARQYPLRDNSPLSARQKPTGSGEPNKIPRHLRHIPSKIKDEVKRDVERFKSPGTSANSSEEEDRKETRIKAFQAQEKYEKNLINRFPFEQGRSDLPPRPGTTRGQEILIDKSPRSMNSSVLIEPRTNKAYVQKLGNGFHRADSIETVGNSVLRITDKFLSDPFMVTLSNQASPRPTQLEPNLWGYS